jgi:hypothetical protein
MGNQQTINNELIRKKVLGINQWEKVDDNTNKISGVFFYAWKIQVIKMVYQ